MAEPTFVKKDRNRKPAWSS
ncbi:hypothetical protein Gotur_019675 [Gossypium turneri]